MITIGIPTYNRAAALFRLLEQVANEETLEGCPVLVIDDGSNDDTEGRLSRRDSSINRHKDRFRCLRNESNLGYPRTFVRLLEECRTDYLLVMADDDLLIPQGVVDTLKFLQEEKPAFVCPQWLRDGNVYRGRGQTRKMTLAEFMDAGHAPGLVYDVERARPHLGKITERIAKDCAFTATYPQVLVCLYLLLEGQPCWYLDCAIAEEGVAAPSGIRDPHGESYASRRSRLRQAASFDEIASQIRDESLRDEVRLVSELAYLKWIYWSADERVRKRFRGTLRRERLRDEIGRRLPAPVKTALKRFLRKQ
jgi:glycosyltransferase involved in cell wall biosynthesis